MKLLNVVFTYDRYFLLRNAVDSILELGPPGDLLVMDDGSEDSRVCSYLDALKADGHSVHVRQRGVDALHGGLYSNMNDAVDYAIGGGYSHIFFLQDDLQFVWRDSELLQRVERVFRERSDAAMVLPIFHKGIIRDSVEARMKGFPEAGAWHLEPYGLCDLGIMPVALLKERAWKFGNSEGENGRIWAEWGYRLYMLEAPSLAWVPWPQVRTAGRVIGRERSTRKKFFLKPLSNEQVTDLKEKGLDQVPYHEDYCVPWGWRCLSPFWFTYGKKNYLRLLWRWINGGGGRWPKIVGTHAE